MADSGGSISVCLCTFKRPALLNDLLDALARQNMDGIGPVQVCVVDNDPEHSARDVLTLWQQRCPGWLTYQHLPVPNIALARNATVAMAHGEWVAFIDDDELPQDNWLSTLMAATRTYQADAVLGPVLPRYVPGTPQWLIDGRYFDRRRPRTGMVLDERDARSGNVLIRAHTLRLLDGPFDPAFGRTGGEDSVLFRSLLRAGAKLVWCDEAPVSEEVPLARANSGWLLKRSYRIGQTWTRAELYHQPQGGVRAMRMVTLACRAAVQTVAAAGLWLLLRPFSRVKAFDWLRKAAANAGKLTGLTRMQYQEYGR